MMKLWVDMVACTFHNNNEGLDRRKLWIPGQPELQSDAWPTWTTWVNPKPTWDN